MYGWFMLVSFGAYTEAIAHYTCIYAVHAFVTRKCYTTALPTKNEMEAQPSQKIEATDGPRGSYLCMVPS